MRREQSRIDQVLAEQRISNINVVQQPTFIEKPVSPKRALLLLTAIALGAVGGLALAVLSALRESSKSSAKKVTPAAFGLPVLLTVPRMHRAPQGLGNAAER